MQPIELKAEQFSNYPPEARKLAEHYTATLAQLPPSFVPSLLREVIEYDYKFPVERKAVEKELETITTLSPADRTEWFNGFAQIKLSQQLVAYDWVNSPGQFVEQLSAHLWATHQLDAFRAAATGYQVLVCTERPQRWKEATGAGLQVVAEAGLAQQLAPARRRWMVVYDKVSGPIPHGAAVTVRTVAAGLPITADVHIEQDGRNTAVIRTWAIQSRLRIDVEHERRLTGSGPGLAA